VRPHWLGFVPALLSVVLASFMGLIKPWPYKFLVDRVLHVGRSGIELRADDGLILLIAGAIVAIAVLAGLLGFLEDFFLSVTAQRVAFELRRSLFAQIQRLSLAFHDRQRTGDLMTRVTSDVQKVEELVTDDLLISGVTSVLQSIGIIVVMLIIDWKLGLVAAASAPAIIFTSSYFRKRIRAQEIRVREKEGDIASHAQEAISSIRVVKAFGREDHETRRFEQQTGEMLEAELKVTRLEAAFSWVLNAVAAVFLGLLVAIGAYQVIGGAVTAGTLIVFIQYMRDLQSPLASLSKLSTKVSKVAIRAERIAEVLDETPAVEDRPGARRAPAFAGHVVFAGVTFAYLPGGAVLEDIDIEIRPGQTVAVVGQTGAGKSTLASLLLRLYDPERGSVRIDGHDIRDFRLDSLVDQIAVVLQESVLFHATIRENIAYGRPHASLKEIQEAARIGYADEFVDTLPNGYETVVGERGASLSGGQRQRIAIARAVIRDAPILVLDEPTTGLDARAEDIVMKALERLMEGRSTLMIAHKLSTARRADGIYVLDRGRVVEHGTHAELMAGDGAYAKAFRSQAAQLIG